MVRHEVGRIHAYGNACICIKRQASLQLRLIGLEPWYTFNLNISPVWALLLEATMPKTRKQPTIHTEASIRSTLETMKITLVGQTIPPNVRTRLHYAFKKHRR
jgi:hypothetical protein